MSPAIKRPIALAMLAATCAYAGPRPDYFVAAKSAPSIRIEHESPTVPLNEFVLRPAIVPAERVAEVGGSELLAQARAEFMARREAKIAGAGGAPIFSGMSNDMSGGDVAGGAVQFGAACLVQGGPIFCALAVVTLPVTLPLAIATVSAVDAGKRAVKRNKAARREAKLVIPENEATRLLGVIEARASTAALAERTAAYAIPADLEDVHARPWLVVRLESINVDTLRDGRVVMRITAQAQAIAPTGTVFPSTKHVYEWVRWSPAEWTAEDSALLEQALDSAVELLAKGIALAYTPSFSLEEQEEDLADAQRTLMELFPVPVPPTPEPVSVLPAANPFTDTGLPQRGDMWLYRLRIPGKNIDRMQRVTVVSATSSAIEEQVATGGERVVRMRHAKGAYLSRDGGLLAFSPYLAAFGSIDASLASARIESRDGCDPALFCSVRVRVVGNEILHVLGQDLEATKVELVQEWMPRLQNGGSGHQTLTMWYAPQAKRVVKISSRGTPDLVIETNFDLELEGYEPTSETGARS